MDEATWLACTDPQRMLEFLRGRASDRKLRLFACACCRHIHSLFRDEPDPVARDVGERLARALGAAERYADDPARLAELREARQLVWGFRSPSAALRDAAWAVRWAVKEMRAGQAPLADAAEPGAVAREAAQRAACAARGAGAVAAADARQAGERWYQRQLVGDLFGNPFRPVALDPSWLTPDVRALAEAAYGERLLPSGHLDPVRLAILADALEEAGCNNAERLGHLRQPDQVHVRGCWALDLVLGRE